MRRYHLRYRRGGNGADYVICALFLGELDFEDILVMIL